MPGESEFVDLNGPVHYWDYGGKGPTFVMVHGLGGSHINWHAVAPALSRHGRVVALDLVAFGLTPPAGRSSSIQANQQLLDDFIVKLDADPAIVVGNSMGGLIAMMEASRAPEHVAGLVLVSPALPPPHLIRIGRQAMRNLLVPTLPVLGSTYLRLYNRMTTPEQYIADVMKFICADPGSIPQEFIDEAVEMARRRRTMPWAPATFTKASQSIAAVLARRRRFDDLTRSIEAPTLLIHGEEDIVVHPGGARHAAELRPDWDVRMLPDIGHVAMLEAPELFVDLLVEWMEDGGRTALRAAAGRRA